MDKISINFGIPDHGWTPTVFAYKDYKLDVYISDVPTDPMLQLCDSLIQLLKEINFPEKILWHLEPYCYYLQIEKQGKNYKIKILESDSFHSKPTMSKEIIGNFESIILPLYRGLKKFNSYPIQHPHWDKLDQKRIGELTELVKKEKEK